jgi:hypothetical protein
MANPNMFTANALYGKLAVANLTTTSNTSIVTNAADSNTVIRLNSLNLTNYTNGSTNGTVSWFDQPGAAGNAFHIVRNVTVPAYSTLTVINKDSVYYVEEGKSIGVTAAAANTLTATASYEIIDASAV